MVPTGDEDPLEIARKKMEVNEEARREITELKKQIAALTKENHVAAKGKTMKARIKELAKNASVEVDEEDGDEAWMQETACSSFGARG